MYKFINKDMIRRFIDFIKSLFACDCACECNVEKHNCAEVENTTSVERDVVAEPAVAEPAVAEPAVAEPAVAEPAVAEPVKKAPAKKRAPRKKKVTTANA